MKKIVFSVAFVLTLLASLISSNVPNLSAAVDLTDGLIAYWPFDDGTNPTSEIVNNNVGNLIGDTEFIVQDAGGTSNDLPQITGNIDAVNIPGGGDFIQVLDNTTLDLPGSFSLSAWVNLNDSRTEHNIISKDTPYAYYFSNYNMHIYQNKTFLAFTFNAPVTGVSVVSGTKAGCDPGGCYLIGGQVINTGTWHYITGVYDDTAKTMRVYVNGELDGEAIFATTGSPMTNDEVVQIGKRKNPWGGPGANAKIDDLRIYNRALSETEIQELYKLGLPPEELIGDIVDTVITLNLQQGISNSLDAKLESALSALDDTNENNDISAINSMDAFINAVEAQRGKKISEADADKLIADALSIIAKLEAM